MPNPESVIKPSSSVILLAPGDGVGFRVFLLKRAGGSSFMPNRFVFPGGKVEPSDGADPASLPAAVACAVRELWEESGVLLAGPAQALAGLSEGELAEARNRVDRGQAGLADTLAGLGLVPDEQALWPYARWVTPKARPQRFDARFFLALLPEGQRAESDQRETSVGLWLSPAQALAENQAGNVELAPPQVRILGELAQETSLASLMSTPRPDWDQPIEPILWAKDGKRVILLPHDPDYPAGQPVQEAAPCPAGQASRLLHQKGLWLPFQA